LLVQPEARHLGRHEREIDRGCGEHESDAARVLVGSALAQEFSLRTITYSGGAIQACTRSSRPTPGSSISAMTRIGPLHLGHSSGSASYTLRISRAQAAFARAANSLTGSIAAVGVSPAVAPSAPSRARRACGWNHHEQHNSLLDLESLVEQALDQLALLQLAAVGVALECTAAT
jgi:hypothetical protein